jgi:hypothetical protein
MFTRLSRVLLLSLTVTSFSVVAQTSTPPTKGLGQSWPNAPDVSASPQFHVYVFSREGVRYVQVNDLNGNVLAAVGSAGGEIIVLPIGTGRVATSQSSTSKTKETIRALGGASPNRQTTVYSDGTLQITASLPGTGAPLIHADGCTDPTECNTHIDNPTVSNSL